jgi:hypothetical protein
MPITDKQRKLIWAGAAIIGVYYFAPSLINASRQAVAPAPAVVAKPSLVHIAAPAPPPPDPAALQAAATSAQFGRLSGNWSGGATLPQGMCRLALQLRTIPEKPGGYSGYSTMICNPSLVLLSQRMPKQERDIEIAKSMTPASTIMSGSVENNAIVFHIDKNIGIPLGGCVITGFTVSPFGGEQIAAQWQAGAPSCQGGQMVPNRVSNLR